MLETETMSAKSHLDSTMTYMVGENAFTTAELDQIVAYGDSLALQKAVLEGDTWRQEDADRIRITRNAWLDLNQDTQWVYERMQALMAPERLFGRFSVHRLSWYGRWSL
jgi:hypothetical protein